MRARNTESCDRGTINRAGLYKLHTGQYFELEKVRYTLTCHNFEAPCMGIFGVILAREC
jgi:hypothetical protein